ncbi:MAG TPA: hypothetical protein VJ821_02985 [Anaerolineales bacterium]|nr:hypothetical protein [Anaerolineales bacterium]
MPKTILKLLLGSVFLIATQACAPSVITPDSNAINTAIAQTSAVLTQTSEPGIPITGDESPTPTASPELPTPSSTMTPLTLFTPTPVLTSTPGNVQVSVSVPTNCRVGPGVVYQRVGALLVDEVAEVVGRHETRDYWIIRNPDRPGETCWLWGQFATVIGNTTALPIFTPPPRPTPTATSTPAPNFSASFDGLESCTGRGWWVDLELENTGGITFQSMSLTVTDTVTNTLLPLDTGSFIDRDGCNETETRPDLPPGATRIVSSPAFPYNVTGHRFVARIILCSTTGLSGTCRTRVIEFTP